MTTETLDPKPVGSKPAMDRRKLLLIVGLGLVLVVFLATRFLGGGGGGDAHPAGVNPPATIASSPAGAPAAGAAAPGAPAAAPAKPGTPAGGPVPNTTRNPFKALH